MYKRTRCEIKTWQHTHTHTHSNTPRQKKKRSRNNRRERVNRSTIMSYCIGKCASDGICERVEGGGGEEKFLTGNQNDRHHGVQTSSLNFPNNNNNPKKKYSEKGGGKTEVFQFFFSLFLALLGTTPDGLLRFSYCCWRGIRGWNTIIHASEHTHTPRPESCSYGTGCEILYTQKHTQGNRQWPFLTPQPSK